MWKDVSKYKLLHQQQNIWIDVMLHPGCEARLILKCSRLLLLVPCMVTARNTPMYSYTCILGVKTTLHCAVQLLYAFTYLGKSQNHE